MNSRFRRFVEYYKSLDSKGGLPLKSAISPARILDLLPNVFIIQRTPDGRVLVRLYGTELVDIFGTDMTGKDAIEFYDSEAGRFLTGYFDNVFGIPCGGILVRRAVTEFGREIVIQSMSLPCANEAGEPEFAFGFTEVQGTRAIRLDAPKDPLKVIKLARLKYLDVGFGTPG